MRDRAVAAKVAVPAVVVTVHSGRRHSGIEDGQPLLERVVDRIHELGEFSETNWSERSVVEISALKKSDGWFFHAITGETWLLKLKFRVYRGTFKRESLLERIKLKTLNELRTSPSMAMSRV